MCVVSAAQRAAAYELLVKLCAERFICLLEPALSVEQNLPGSNTSNDMQVQAISKISDCALLLAEAISYRNELKLSTEMWGAKRFQSLDHVGGIAGCHPTEFKAKLEPLIASGRSSYGVRAPGLISLASVLHLVC